MAVRFWDARQQRAARRAVPPRAGAASRGRLGRRGRRRQWEILPFVLPAAALFGVFMIYPIVYSLVKSFTNWPVIVPASWVGFANYYAVLTDPVIPTAFINALLYLVISVPLQVALGLLAAVGLNRPIFGRGTFRLGYYVPVITSWVVVTYIFQYLFNTQYGIVNNVLLSVHLISTPVAWLADPKLAILVAGLLGTWKGIGWSMLIFLAAIQSVPEELYEASALDGANRWKQLRHITIPHIKAATTFVIVMLTIGAFQVFIQIFILTGGGPANETQVPLTYMYEQAFTDLNFGYAGALSWLMALIIIAFSIVNFALIRPQGLSVGRSRL
jgi:multiple sugar transport system permease protein